MTEGGLLPQPGGIEGVGEGRLHAKRAHSLERVAVSAERAGRGICGLRDGQHLNELAYFLVGHSTGEYGVRHALCSTGLSEGAHRSRNPIKAGRREHLPVRR